jgi:hypothetical protein
MRASLVATAAPAVRLTTGASLWTVFGISALLTGLVAYPAGYDLLRSGHLVAIGAWFMATAAAVAMMLLRRRLSIAYAAAAAVTASSFGVIFTTGALLGAGRAEDPAYLAFLAAKVALLGVMLAVTANKPGAGGATADGETETARQRNSNGLTIAIALGVVCVVLSQIVARTP